MKGLTLIELLVVIAIIAILIATAKSCTDNRSQYEYKSPKRIYQEVTP
jgi:prepilin-type N-terminal cleavage/methylation domain-containing protein